MGAFRRALPAVTVALSAALVAPASPTAAAAPGTSQAASTQPTATLVRPWSPPPPDDALPYAPRSTPLPTLRGPLLRSVAPDTVAPAASATSTTLHELDVVVASPAGSPADGLDPVVTDDDVRSLVADVSSYWSGQSAGKVTFGVKVIDRVTAPQGLDCGSDTGITRLWTQASEAVSGHDWWAGGDPAQGPPAREHLVVLYPYAADDPDGSTTCDGTVGLGTTPDTASVTQNGLTFALFGAPGVADHTKAPQFADARDTLAHELGHNFGLEHAGAWWCSGTPTDGAFTSPSCTMLSYLDPFDVMGAAFGGTGIPTLSAPQKSRLGLLTSAQQRTITATTTATLVPAGAAGLESLVVTDPATKEKYWVEYRRPTGDITYPSGPRSPLGGYQITPSATYSIGYGVRILRLAPSTTALWEKNEMSVVPVGTATARRSYLAAGTSFTTRGGKITVKVASAGTTGASVTVLVHKTPSLTLKRSATSQRYAQTAAKLTATVGTVDGRHGTGTVTFKDGTTTLKKVRTSSAGVATLTLPKSLKVGKHTLTASFTPDATSAARGVDPAATVKTTVTVAKATSSVSVKLVKATVTKGTAPKLTVHVKVAGVAAPTGKVTVKQKGKTVKTVTVTKARKGVVTVTLPKATKRGTFTLQAVYAGTASIASRTSAKVTLHVK